MTSDPDDRRARLTRRAVLTGSAGVVVAAAVGGVAVNRATDDPPPTTQPEPSAPVTRTFVSRPDLNMPVVTVVDPAPAGAGGQVLLTPAAGQGLRGPMLVDPTGALVWVRALSGPADLVAADAQVQSYQGRPVLTWWEGTVDARGVGEGELVIADSAYHEVARLRVDGGPVDLHEFVLTAAGTALCLTYQEITADLTGIGGAPAAPMYDGLVHEVDVGTGRTLFTWRASEHIAVDESYQPIASTVASPAAIGAPTNVDSAPSGPLPFDYVHLNSVAEDGAGHLLVSARHTATVYRLDRATGQVAWRLGGRRSDFTLGAGARFWFQHDARRRSDGTLSVFDNGAGVTTQEPRSRGLILRVDEQARTATVIRELPQPQGFSAASQGSLRELPDGGNFIGWGARPWFTEFGADGAVRFAGHLPADNSSYRAMRVAWTGAPADVPALVLRIESGAPVAYVSWNGATRVARWQLRAGAGPDTLAGQEPLPRTGFETRLPVPTSAAYVAVTALAADGARLADSAVQPLPN